MTHSERVLQLLSDHQPHGHMELYRLGVMAHSRVADLRRRGHNIKCWRDGDTYLYQLVGTVRVAENSLCGDGGSATRTASTSAVPPNDPQLGSSTSGPAGPAPSPENPRRGQQLQVWENAA